MTRRLINQRPNRGQMIIFGLMPFVILLLVRRRLGRPAGGESDDKLLPAPRRSPTRFAAWRSADSRTGDILLWADTAASLQRLGLGLLVATVLGLIVGIATG
jgi:NitT/TauT family transport system permease protein